MWSNTISHAYTITITGTLCTVYVFINQFIVSYVIVWYIHSWFNIHIFASILPWTFFWPFVFSASTLGFHQTAISWSSFHTLTANHGVTSHHKSPSFNKQTPLTWSSGRPRAILLSLLSLLLVTFTVGGRGFTEQKSSENLLWEKNIGNWFVVKKTGGLAALESFFQCQASEHYKYHDLVTKDNMNMTSNLRPPKFLFGFLENALRYFWNLSQKWPLQVPNHPTPQALYPETPHGTLQSCW